MRSGDLEAFEAMARMCNKEEAMTFEWPKVVGKAGGKKEVGKQGSDQSYGTARSNLGKK